MVRWTDRQREVIDTRGKNMLVSAAAGSGKTAVLVERIIEKVARDENPIDVDRLLVVTFTRAAASQMRERLLRELAREASLRPDDEHLSKQLSYIHNASIMTIDSFCNMVLRENFISAGIDPSYRIGDENELSLIRTDVIRDILEEHYEAGDEEFINFVEMNVRGRDDSGLEKLIENIYNYACSHADPDKWLDQCVKNYDCDAGVAETAWFKETVRYVDRTLESCADMAKRALRIIDEYGLLKYRQIFADERDCFLAAAGE